MTQRPRWEDLPPVKHPPEVIHTILDFDRRLVYSTHDVYEFIAPDARLLINKALGDTKMPKTTKKTAKKKMLAKKAKTAVAKIQRQAVKRGAKKTVMARAKRKTMNTRGASL